MTIQFVLPITKSNNTKNLVFSILIDEQPLKLITITRRIRKRGKSITPQAVRKAVLQLVEEEIILKEGVEYSINKEWIANTKERIDALYLELQSKREKPVSETINGELSLFVFDSVKKMIRFWQNLIYEIYKVERKTNINVYQGAHLWESLLFAETEKDAVTEMIKRGIKSYALIMSKTPLDYAVARFYRGMGVQVKNKESKDHNRAYYVGTYGELVFQTKIPKKIAKELDDFFNKTKKLEDLDLNKLSEIVNQKAEVKVTLIKDLDLAKQINERIIKLTS